MKKTNNIYLKKKKKKKRNNELKKKDLRSGEWWDVLDYRSLESLPPKHLTPPRNDTVQHFNFNRERNGGENKPVDTEHSVALKPFTPSTHFQVNQTHPPFSSKPLILIFFSIKKSFILHVHKLKLWQESSRWWRALCFNNSALLRQCPSPHGQRLHHHRHRCHCPLSGSLSLLLHFLYMGFAKTWFWMLFFVELIV